MSVQSTAGPLDISGDPDPVLGAVAAAERVLRRRYGATIRLADPEPLGGSGRSTVIRVRVAATPFDMPRTIVVKHYGTRAAGEIEDGFAHEAVSYQLFNAITADERMGPELYAQDTADRVIVMEDLGRGATLADKLHRPEARPAETALLGWARQLGRMHVSTSSHEADFDALMRRTGARCGKDPLEPGGRAALTGLPDLLTNLLGVATSEEVREFAKRTEWLVTSPEHRAFSPSSACPENTVLTSKGMRLLDFEGGCMRNVLLDVAFLRVPFPSCWCAYGLPPGMRAAMLAAWRSEVSVIWPEFSDDAVLLPQVFDAQLFWVWRGTWRVLPRLAAGTAETVGRNPRRAVSLAARWRRLHVDAERAGVDHVAAHAKAVATALGDRLDGDDLPLYPAFR